MTRTTLPTEQILTLLRDAPLRISEATAGLTPAQLRTLPEPGEWSAVDILAHLRSCADVWGDCMTKILAEDNPTLRAVNPRTWIKRTNYSNLEFQPLFEAFAAQRSSLLNILDTLTPERWSRSATVTGAGRPLVWTVQTYARRLVLHERSHVTQIERLANRLGNA